MNKNSKFKAIMNTSSIIFTFLTIAFFVLFHLYKDKEILEILAITCLTIAFHFDIRLILGNLISKFKKYINTNKKYYRLNKFEEKIYNIIKVKKWKRNVSTYNPDEFDIKKNSKDELIRNMCNSEIIHTINVFISYIPLLFIIWFNQPIAFIITSIIASLYDLHFVIIQRYNRERLMKIIEKNEY